TCVVTNGDICGPQGFIMHRRGGEDHIAQVLSIIRRYGSPDDAQSLAEWIALEIMDTSMVVHPYGMPLLQPTGTHEICCTVNVQHNCHSNGCGLGATQPVFQECEHIATTAPAVLHLNPREMILNLGQMRDSTFLHPWLLAVPPVDRHTLLISACRRAHEQQRDRLMRDTSDLSD
ncbi:hypothetical protein JB92DRAFT_2721896, partial [Gautieria morchelliformis]